MYRIKVKSTATPYVNVRQAASTSSTDIGDVYPNSEYDADYYELDAAGNKFDHVPALGGYVMRQYTTVISGTEVPKPVNPPSSDTTITSVRFSGEVIFDYASGAQEVWHVTDMPFIKGPSV